MPQQTDSTQKKVVVVGAGSIGISCALFLQKDGHDVTLIDRDPPGEGCSSGNAGLLSRASFLPLASPSVLREVPKWLLNPMGPLALRWSYLPKIMPWLIRYAYSGMTADVYKTGRALQILTDPCVDLYIDLAKQAGRSDLIKRAPYMYAYETTKKFKKTAADFNIKREFGIVVEELHGGAVTEFEPALSDIYKHAYVMPDHAFTINPLALMQALADLFAKRGGTILQREVRDIIPTPEGGARVVCAGEEFEADRAVVATGAFSLPFAKKLGAPVPLDTERGYHVVLPNSGSSAPKIPVMSGEGHFLATPMEMGLRLAGTVELAGVDAPPNYARARVLLKLGQRMFPGLNTEGYTEWMGRRPTLPDSMPVIGPSPKSSSVLFAFGHQHIGLMSGPKTGQIIASLVSGRKINEDISAFRADRF